MRSGLARCRVALSPETAQAVPRCEPAPGRHSGFSLSISARASAVACSMASCRVSTVDRIRRETRLSQ